MPKPSLKEVLAASKNIAEARVTDSDNFENGFATKLVEELAENPTLQKKFKSKDLAIEFIIGVEVGYQLAKAEAYA